MEHIHTKIDRPLEFRKHLLESAIDAGDMIKSCEQAKQILSDKDLFSGQVKEKLQQLSLETEHLLETLPPVPDEFRKEKPLGGKKSLAEPQKRFLDERDKLEQDLAELRRKIAGVTV